MPRDPLHQTLDDLHRQLEAAESIDDAARAHLQSVMQEIRELLDRPTSERHRSGVIARLRESVEHFEGEHPTLTSTVLEVIETLRKIV